MRRIIGGFVLAALAGCTTAAAPPVPTTTPPPSSVLTSTGDPTRISVASALPATEGAHYVTLFRLTQPTDQSTFVAPLALADDGSLVAEAVEETGTAQLEGVPELGRYAPERGDSYPQPLKTPPRQAIAAAVRGSTVAWLETSSTNLYSADWFLFASTGGAARLLSRSSDISGETEVASAPEQHPIATDGKTVFWTAPYPVPSDGSRPYFSAKVLSTPVDGSGEVRTIADPAKLPATDGTSVYVVRAKDVAPDLGDRALILRVGGGKEVVVADLSLTPRAGVSAVCAAGDYLSWVVSDVGTDDVGGDGVLTVRDLRTGEDHKVELLDSGSATNLSCSDTLIGWGNGSGNGDAGEYVLVLRSWSLYRLGEEPGISIVYVKGDYVAWSVLTYPRRAADTVVARWEGG